MAQAEPQYMIVEEAHSSRTVLIQGELDSTGGKDPFPIFVTSRGILRCYNWGLFREGRFSQPPSCELSPVVISHARRREGFAVAEHGLPHWVRRSPASDTAGLDGPFPTATFWFANPIASASSQDDPSQHSGNWIAQDSLARTS